MTTTTAVVTQLHGITLAGKAKTNHWVMMDGPEQFGGSSAGPRPNELVLLALGGCTESDVITILQKMRVDVDHVEVRLTATVSDEQPKAFTAIHMEYVFSGADLRRADLERAISLSLEKYCPVAAMLRPNVAITTSFCTEPSRVLATEPA
jgi:putative redox protein